MKNRSQRGKSTTRRISSSLSGVVGLLLAFCLIASIGITPALADTLPPGPPHQFWGSVTIGGSPAPLGTVIAAKIGGIQYASAITDTSGRYGYATTFTVPADDPNTPAKDGGVDGDTVSLYVGATLATTAIFQNGMIGYPSGQATNLAVTPLTVTINQAAGQADPTSTLPINFTVIFSATVTDFITGDVQLSGTAGATTGTVTGSGTTYTVAVTGMTGSGTVIANILAGMAHDALTNPNATSTSTDNTITYNAAPPAVPTLIAPADGSNQALTSIIFQWNAFAGANRYWLCIKKVSDGTNFYSADVGNVTTFTVPGFPNNGTQYKWTVNPGVVGVSWGAPSSLWTFTNGTAGAPPAGPPPAPTLIAPANVSNQALASIIFQWNASTGANRYWLCVKKVSDGTNFYSADVGNVITFTVPGFPNDGTQYKWTVNPGVVGVSWCAPSSTWTFTNGAAPAAPAAPTLLSPGTAITFKWNASTGATKYQLQVNTNATFTGTDIYNADVGNVTTQEATGATLGATYYWQVRAGNATGWSAWSAVRSVLTNTVP